MKIRIQYKKKVLELRRGRTIEKSETGILGMENLTNVSFCSRTTEKRLKKKRFRMPEN